MTDLVKLCQEKLDAQNAYFRCAIANTHGKTAAELVELDLAYSQAQARLQQATRAYEQALIAAAEK